MIFFLLRRFQIESTSVTLRPRSWISMSLMIFLFLEIIFIYLYDNIIYFQNLASTLKKKNIYL